MFLPRFLRCEEIHLDRPMRGTQIGKSVGLDFKSLLFLDFIQPLQKVGSSIANNNGKSPIAVGKEGNKKNQSQIPKTNFLIFLFFQNTAQYQQVCG